MFLDWIQVQNAIAGVIPYGLGQIADCAAFGARGPDNNYPFLVSYASLQLTPIANNSFENWLAS